MASTTGELWNESLHASLARVQGKKYRGLFFVLDYQSFEQSLVSLDKTYGDKRFNSCLRSLEPLVDYLRSFSAAVSTAIQSNPQVAALVWGGIQAVLICAAKYADILKRITGMIADLTVTISRLDRYIKLFPANMRLQSTLRGLYEEYTGFCISAVVFLKKWPLYNLIRMFWSTLKEEFEARSIKIIQIIDKFELESRITVDEVTVIGTRAIQAALPQLNISPRVTIPFRDLFHSRNEKFVGRDEDLKAIHDGLLASSTGPTKLLSLCVHGTGGMGKTQLAVEYTYRYPADADYIFWLPAETPVILASAFGSLFDKLSLGEASTDEHSKIQRVQQWLGQNTKWLLIFDNAESWSSIQPYWPTYSHGAVLITTQHPDLAQVTSLELHLKPLSTEMGTELLFKHLRRVTSVPMDERTSAASIVEELGGLPLAVAHIAGYIDQSQSSLNGFLVEFYERRHGSEIWNGEPSASTAHYMPGKLGTVWDIAINALQPAAKKLLEVLAFLNPDSIPEDIFDMLPQDQFPSTTFNKLIANLRRRHLIYRMSADAMPSLSIHRSLQKDVIFKLDEQPAARQAAFELALNLVRRVYPKRSELEIPASDKWDHHQKYLPQIISLHIHYKEASTGLAPSLELADILADTGTYLWQRGDITAGMNILQTADTLCQQFPEDVAAYIWASVLQSLQAIEFENGISTRSQGLLHLQERARLREKYRNDQDRVSELLLSNAWHDLGCGNLECENFDVVEDFLEKSFAIKKIWGSPESIPFEYAVHYEDLAYLRLAQGRTIEAVQLIAKAVALLKTDENVNGDALGQFNFDWAVVLLNSGQFQPALEKSLEALTSRVQLFGANSAKALHSLYWTANIHLHMDNRMEAEVMFKDALERAKVSNWSEETIARAEYRYSQLLRKEGRDDEANTFESHALRSAERMLPSTVMIPEGCEERLAVFDQMVSIYLGRSTGKLWVGHLA